MIAAMRVGRSLFIVYCSLIGFALVGSAASMWFKIAPGPIEPATGFCLILSGAACLATEFGDWRKVAIVLAFSAAAEVVGLYTGFPFGRYEYTSHWWPSLPLTNGHQFPFLLPFAWFMVVGGSYLSVRQLVEGWQAVALTALVTALIDAPMERGMTTVFRYWTWLEQGRVFGAPLQNSFGWAAVSAIAAGVLLEKSPASKVSRGPQVLALFCVFVSLSGLLRFSDPAWALLLAFAAALWWIGVAAQRRTK